MRPFRNYSIEIDNAIKTYDINGDLDQFQESINQIKASATKNKEALAFGVLTTDEEEQLYYRNKEYRGLYDKKEAGISGSSENNRLEAIRQKQAHDKKVKFLTSNGKGFTAFNDFESLSNSKYVIKPEGIREIISVKKINPITTEYSWVDPAKPGVVYQTKVDSKGNENTKQAENPIKFSLGHTDNSDDTQSPAEEAIRFGRLVSDIVARIKEGIVSLDDLRQQAGVTVDTYELFEQAYDIALIRAGENPHNTRQQGIYKMIDQLPSGDQRPTAQELYLVWKPMLDDLGINMLMLKQILPDQDLLKDESINKTWRRILKVTDDVGKFLSQTIDRAKKFEITDFEGINSQEWDHTAIGFTNMLSYVENAVRDNPENKAKLEENVKAALKDNPDDQMLRLLQVAIAASGETSLGDLSKIIREGTLAGRVLNVIKRYIGGENFGRVKIDLAAATVMADNDDILAATKAGQEQDAISLLDLADQIRDIIAISKMTTDEREEFFNENEDILSGINEFLKGIGLSKGHRAPNDKRKAAEAKKKISKGLLSLTDALKKSNPELLKFSKNEFDKEAIKSIKQIIRGIIDLHGQSAEKLLEELTNTFNDANILIDPNKILGLPEIKEYITNIDRHKIREGVIREMNIDDQYSKTILDNMLKALNLPTETKDKKDALLDALDRGELTKELLDSIKKEINKIKDPEKKNALLEKIDKKFIVIFDVAIPSKSLAGVVAESIGKITRDMVSAYITDPDRSVSLLAAKAITGLGLTPKQATAWAYKVEYEVTRKLNKAKKAKIKSLLSQKVTNKSRAETLEEKIFKIITEYANTDGTIPSASIIDEQMLDIKAVIADKYAVKLNDAKAIAKIIKLTNLLRVARTHAAREALYSQIMLAAKNMKLSPNRYVRVLKSGILEMSNFVMANILSGVNSAYKAFIGGVYNSARAYIYDAIIGRGVDWVYRNRDLTKQTMESLKNKRNKEAASHQMIAFRLFYDLMRHGSAAVSQANIPEHGLSNFDNHLNNVFLLRTLYSPFRFLSAVDIGTMTMNFNRLAYRKAINNIMEFGRNNASLNGQAYRRTEGGASWYMVDSAGTPLLDSVTGNIEVVRDPKLKKVLDEQAKQNVSTSEFLGQVEELLGTNRIDQFHSDMVDEWNALVDLQTSGTATPEELNELKILGLHKEKLVKVNSMEDFKSMSRNIRSFVATEIHKKVRQNMNAALARDVAIETGGYSAQGMEIPGVPAGIVYRIATIIDSGIQGGLNHKSFVVRAISAVFLIPAKIYSTLITKAPSIGYGTALMFTPISFLVNLVNLGSHMTGRPFMRITFDAKDKVWRYNGLSLQDVKNATGKTYLSAGDLMVTKDPDVLRVLKEGYTIISQDQNQFELKPATIKTIGGQGGSVAIGSMLAKQALATASFMTLLALMYDCPEDEECEMNDFGREVMNFFSIRGYGAMKNWLDSQGWAERYLGYRAVVDKYGDPHKETVALSPQIGEVELKIPLNEMNNAVAAITLARIKDEMAAGVKLTRSDIMLRYLVYSNFDLLYDTADMSVEGLSELREVVFAFFEETYTRDKKINKASTSVAKRMMASLTPKMLNDLDKMLLDAENVQRLSVDAQGFWEQLAKKIPANVPFYRRYLKENDPETYSDSPFQYEWTDWQFYLKRQKEAGDASDLIGIRTGKHLINPSGRVTLGSPDGEVDKIKADAMKAGKGNDYIPNGWFNVGDHFNKLFEQAVKDSNIDELIDAGNKEGALDLMKELADVVKNSPDFKAFKKSQFVKNQEEDPDAPTKKKETWD